MIQANTPPGSSHEANPQLSPSWLDTIARNSFKRREALDRIGLGRNGPLHAVLRICDDRNYEEVTIAYPVPFFEKDNGKLV